jgi:hypothetical protein
MATKRQNPLLPAIILVLFFGLLVFMFVGRKSQTGTSHLQSVTENR